MKMVGSARSTLLLSKIVPAYAGPPERYFRSKALKIGFGAASGAVWVDRHTSALPQSSDYCRIARAGSMWWRSQVGCDEKGQVNEAEW